MIISRISVSLHTISSATLFAKSEMRCNRSKSVEGIWSYLFRSFKTYKVGFTSGSDTSVARTNLKCDTGKTEDSLCDWVQLVGVNPLWFPYGRANIGERTSAKTAPYFIALSTTLSVDASIVGEYFSNNSSSSLSDERRDSAYAKSVSWLG